MADSSFDWTDASLLCDETIDFCFDDLDSVTDDDLESVTDHSVTDNQNLGVTDDDKSESLVDLPMLSEEVFSVMVESEKEYLPKEDYLKRLRNGGLGAVRKEAIDWIWKDYAHFGFEPLSFCLSVNYLDRFLSLSEVPDSDEPWMGQLLAVTCLSLATKMEEPTVPLGVDLQAREPEFVFGGKTIQGMELQLLKALKWRMRACTPFSFVDYFIGKINDDQHPSGSMISRSVPFILSAIKGINFLEFKPSEIAAAVALHVSGKIEPAEIPNALSCFVNLEVGRVSNCVEMIQHLPLLTTDDEDIGASPPESPIGVLDADNCLSHKIEDLAGGSSANSSHGSPETKRIKLDHNPSQETDFE
ncbi:hypothetical protein Vadar_008739 [Vaccinium darrowii]|uniref:Uncharacterized protein n=1 Tax=Vaccinium darrowii TaxID=229202 RepID=A0ACB7YDK7_9ERIC|nr:hypothetical protein Vadar_008739 [Vaccinium darrowii]